MNQERVPVMIPAETLGAVPLRLFGAVATAKLLAREAEGDLSDALELLSHSINSVCIDLDVCAWPTGTTREELREATNGALSEDEAPERAEPASSPRQADMERFHDQTLTLGIFLTQARGVVESVIALKPVAGELNDGEITQALYAAVDQLNRACDIVDGKVADEVRS